LRRLKAAETLNATGFGVITITASASAAVIADKAKH
jgi:hypothetical protein